MSEQPNFHNDSMKKAMELGYSVILQDKACFLVDSHGNTHFLTVTTTSDPWEGIHKVLFDAITMEGLLKEIEARSKPQEQEEDGKIEVSEKIIEWTLDQAKHIRLYQMFLHQFMFKLQCDSILHDKTKFSKKEMPFFVNQLESLKNATSGDDEEYKKNLQSEGVQTHYKYNSHHPEYWKDKTQKMPFTEIINMYFDWCARGIDKEVVPEHNDGHGDFWGSNLKKLTDCGQQHAIPVVEALRAEFPLSRFKLHMGEYLVEKPATDPVGVQKVAETTVQLTSPKPADGAKAEGTPGVQATETAPESPGEVLD